MKIASTIVSLALAAGAAAAPSEFEVVTPLVNQSAFDLSPTRDGGFIATGELVDANGSRDILLSKHREDGFVEWQVRIGNPGLPEIGFSVHQLQDGGYAIAGEMVAPGAATASTLLVRTDPIGIVLWARQLPGGRFNERPIAPALDLLPNGDIVVVSRADLTSPNGLVRYGLAARFSPFGALLFASIYDFPGDNRSVNFTDVRATESAAGGPAMVISGYFANADDFRNPFALYLDNAGNNTLAREYLPVDPQGSAHAVGISPTPLGHVLVGRYFDPNSPDDPTFIYGLDPALNLTTSLLHRQFSVAHAAIATDTPRDRVLIAGHRNTDPAAGTDDGAILSVALPGAPILWENNYGRQRQEVLRAVIPNGDCIRAVGESQNTAISPGSYVVVADDQGRTGCQTRLNIPELNPVVRERPFEFVRTFIEPRIPQLTSVRLDPGSVTLCEACPADFNGDGFIDFFDFDAYVECFNGGRCPPCRTADFNGDGFIDFFDYDDFVLAFERGC